MSFLDSAEDPKHAARRPLQYFLLATLAVGAAASLISVPDIPRWYDGLIHPAFTPPDWVLLPLWTALYALMALAAWRVWKITGLKSGEMVAYAVQLALNFLWCVIFFGLHWTGLAFAEISLLLLAVLVTTLLFARRDRIAGLLFLPCLAWTGFAVLLAWGFQALNP